jgi:hypothetical protein
MANVLQIKGNQHLKDQAVQHAFLQNHPNHSTEKTITVSNMIEALHYYSNEAAEQYLSSPATPLPHKSALRSSKTVMMGIT